MSSITTAPGPNGAASWPLPLNAARLSPRKPWWPMRAENWERQEAELAGWPVTVTAYRIGEKYITEVATTASGATVARSIAPNAEESRKGAFETASRRLQRTRHFDLTIGG